MPRVEGADSASVPRPMTPNLNLKLTLKRDRPFEPRIPAGACLQRCCAQGPAPSLVAKRLEDENDINNEPADRDSAFFAPFPPQDEDEFELGPPPPAPPMLCRQNAMDATAAMQAKLAMARRTDAHLSVRSAMATSRVRGCVVAPIMAHESLSLPILPN